MKYQSNGDIDSKKIAKERKNSRIRTESASSANSVELNPARVRKTKNHSLFESENSQDEMVDSTSPIKNIKKDSSDGEKFSDTQTTKPLSNDTVLTPVPKDPVIKNSILKDSESPCNGNIEKVIKSPVLSPKLSTKSAVKHRKRLKSFDQSDEDEEEEEEKFEKKKYDKKDNEISASKKPVKAKKQKIEKQEQIKDKVTLKEKKKTINYVPKKDKVKKKKDKAIICNGKKKKVPEPPQLNLLEINKSDAM